MKTEKFSVTGMTCAACQANVTRRVQKLDGVQDVNVNLLANQMTVTYDEEVTGAGRIIDAVKEIGYGASPLSGDESRNQSSFRSVWESRERQAADSQESLRRRLIASVVLLLPLMYVSMGGMLALPQPGILTGMDNALIGALTQLFITIPILIINQAFFKTGFRALYKRAPNMDSLVAIGSGAALVYGIFALYRMAYGFGHGDMELVHNYAHALYFESAAMILTLVTVGKYLEARSKAKTSGALGKLVDLAPKTASVLRNGTEQTIPAEQVVTGDLVIIRPGDRIPVDGVLTEGSGFVDQSAITGESIPVEKTPGDSVISATINKNGTFTFRASRVGENTTLAQIIRLVDEAGSSKAPIARLADKVSGVFVPVVIGIAILTAIVWLVAGQTFEFALSSAISVLVISCPCALGLATPVAIMVGTGKAAESGILIKSAESLETLHSIDTIVLDKTGTITSGHPSVTDITVLDSSLTETEFLAIAAAVESGSEHPLAQAVAEKAHTLTLPAVSGFSATPGRGVEATVSGQRWYAGNTAFLREAGVSASALAEAESLSAQLSSAGKTPLLFAREGRLVGIIAVADTIRDSSRAAIEAFRQLGLHVVMLTGDNRLVADAIGRELALNEVVAEVLPTDKEAKVRALQAQGRKVAMVGDGINDAPALMRADVGIAIGAGTDIAIESADVVLMKDSLYDAVTAIRLSRSVIRNIRMNLFWAFFYNISGIPLAAGALYPAFHLRLSPMIGSAAMSLSSVCVVTNALRLRFFKGDAPKMHTQEITKTPVNSAPSETKGETSMKKVIAIEGMMCAHCQAHVQKALNAVNGVQEANVELDKNQATVTLSQDISDAALMSAVNDAGYTATGCRTL